MRLWHQDLLPLLPRQQLLGQHRECCALRGKGWGKPHSVVNYVFEHPISILEDYHFWVMSEMERRGYRPSLPWWMRGYRGKAFGEQRLIELIKPKTEKAYEEHNEAYLKECVENLRSKGIVLAAWGM